MERQDCALDKVLETEEVKVRVEKIKTCER